MADNTSTSSLPLSLYTSHLNQKELMMLLDVYRWNDAFLRPLHVTVHRNIPSSDPVFSVKRRDSPSRVQSNKPTEHTKKCLHLCLPLSAQGGVAPSLCERKDTDDPFGNVFASLRDSANYLDGPDSPQPFSRKGHDEAVGFIETLTYHILPTWPGHYYRREYRWDPGMHHLSYGSASKAFTPVGALHFCYGEDCDYLPGPLIVIFRPCGKRAPPSKIPPQNGFAREAACIIAVAQEYFKQDCDILRTEDVCRPYIVSIRPRSTAVFVTASVTRSYVDGIRDGLLLPSDGIDLMVSEPFDLKNSSDRLRFTEDYIVLLEGLWEERLEKLPPPLGQKRN
ncbi:hypothetical protein K440DRAFT_624056 [Wilcoxina mikolae CBS 423.85]|nr:hypothetical protein K440DRAFT_624056 [Wilcoxina mikolae CBS 423.85]